jgi:hypothetical protein
MTMPADPPAPQVVAVIASQNTPTAATRIDAGELAGGTVSPPRSPAPISAEAIDIAAKIARHAEKPYPQWVEPGIYYVSLESEIAARVSRFIEDRDGWRGLANLAKAMSEDAEKEIREHEATIASLTRRNEELERQLAQADALYCNHDRDWSYDFGRGGPMKTDAELLKASDGALARHAARRGKGGK